MNWELIAWIGVWILISEIIFIFWYKFDPTNWILTKISSFCIGIPSILIQMFILFDFENETIFPLHYERLIYEVIIIIGIALLFGLNKLIVIWIDKKDKSKQTKK